MISCRRRVRLLLPLFSFLSLLSLLSQSALLLALSEGDASANSAAGFVIIVNPANSVTSLAPEQVARIFTKKQTHWDDGSTILPVDLRGNSKLRARFTHSIHTRSIEAIKNFWRKQIFTGRAVPPPEKASESEVLAFVSSHAGAIGYVSRRISLRGVKVISLDP